MKIRLIKDTNGTYKIQESKRDNQWEVIYVSFDAEHAHKTYHTLSQKKHRNIQILAERVLSDE